MTEENAPSADRHTGPPRRSRRAVLAAVVALGAGASILATQRLNMLARVDENDIDAGEAFRKAKAGEILLVDIRRPDEWSRSGIPAGAVPLDMRRADFIEALLHHLGGDTDRYVALICARGVRSGRLAAALANAGFARIIDVPEGMKGSGAGPGWIARGLPVQAWSGE